MEEKLLPIGTVVKIKNTNGNIFLIAGYFPQGTPTPEHIYDYSGFIYPMGYTGTMDVYQFDKEQIEEIIVYGYQDKEQLEFMEKLIGDIPLLKYHKEGGK